MADLVQVRAGRRVRRRVGVDCEIEEAEARRFAALDAHFAARLDRVLLQVLVEPRVQAISLGNLPPRAAHAVRAVVPHVDFGEVQNRASIHVRLEPVVRPHAREVGRPERHVRVIALVLDLVVRGTHVERGGRAHRVDRVGRDVPAVALAALRGPHLELIDAPGEVGLPLIGLEAADARERLPLVVDVPVHARREVQVLEVELLVVLEIVEAGAIVAGRVGRPEARHELRAERIEAVRGDSVAGERVANDLTVRTEPRRPGIVDDAKRPVGVERLREVAGPLERRRHRQRARQHFGDARRFDAREQEHAVAAKRHPERAAGLAVRVVAVLTGHTIGDGVPVGVAADVVAGAVIRVRSRLQRHADDAAGAVPELRIDRVGRHVELGDGVHRRRVGDLGAGFERRAVEQHVVATARAAADVHVVARPMMVRRHLILVARVADDRAEIGELRRVARDIGNRLEEALVERQVFRTRIELNRDGLCFHRDRFRQRRDFHRDVGGHVAARLHDARCAARRSRTR